MSALNLSIHPTRLDGEPQTASRVSQPTGKTNAATRDVPAASLQSVMRSSRARAWIPPHLIESLRSGS